ncbi:MAG TPA: hypothetical protein VJ836_04705 [Candidatus Saccharimonadales bacterium]|nr:hypothetical protein [Candidatus Saccharimonadales bacterium]
MKSLNAYPPFIPSDVPHAGFSQGGYAVLAPQDTLGAVTADMAAWYRHAAGDNKRDIHLLVPGVGSGRAVGSLIAALETKVNANTPWTPQNVHIHAFDNNPQSVAKAKSHVQQRIQARWRGKAPVEFSCEVGDWYDDIWTAHSGKYTHALMAPPFGQKEFAGLGYESFPDAHLLRRRRNDPIGHYRQLASCITHALTRESGTGAAYFIPNDTPPISQAALDLVTEEFLKRSANLLVSQRIMPAEASIGARYQHVGKITTLKWVDTQDTFTLRDRYKPHVSMS